MTLVAGTRLGPYEVVSLLGAGGMGEVYRARDGRLGRDVAIKVLHASFSADPDRLRRFEHEARAAGILNHPNITAVYDVGSHEGMAYVVTELLEGETLRQVLLRRAPTTRQVLSWAIQAAHGLSAAHEKGIVHRDLKPAKSRVARPETQLPAGQLPASPRSPERIHLLRRFSGMRLLHAFHAAGFQRSRRRHPSAGSAILERRTVR